MNNADSKELVEVNDSPREESKEPSEVQASPREESIEPVEVKASPREVTEVPVDKVESLSKNKEGSEKEDLQESVSTKRSDLLATHTQWHDVQVVPTDDGN